MYNRIKKNYHLFLEKYQINKKINDIRLGINKANSLKTLPIKWDNFHNHIITRIVRFILGVITGIGLINMNKTIIPTYGYDFTIDIIMLINFIYITSVSMTRLIYIIKILYNKEYEIRNSPLNYLGSKVGNIWLCVKGVCTVIGTSGGILGGLVIYDNIIERTGRNRIFMPKIEYVTDKILTKIGINKNEIMIKDINESIKDKVVQIEEISKDIKEINKLLTSIEYKPDKELLEIFNNEIQKDILKELNKIQEEQKRLDQAYKNIIKKR